MNWMDMCPALAPEEELALHGYVVSRVHEFIDCPLEMILPGQALRGTFFLILCLEWEGEFPNPDSLH